MRIRFELAFGAGNGLRGLRQSPRRMAWSIKAGSTSTPLTYSLRRDDRDFVVFCFVKPEDAEAFAERLGGKRLATSSRP
jgi:hypothetical protein